MCDEIKKEWLSLETLEVFTDGKGVVVYKTTSIVLSKFPNQSKFSKAYPRPALNQIKLWGEETCDKSVENGNDAK